MESAGADAPTDTTQRAGEEASPLPVKTPDVPKRLLNLVVDEPQVPDEIDDEGLIYEVDDDDYKEDAVIVEAGDEDGDHAYIDDVPLTDSFDVTSYPAGEFTRLRFRLMADALGESIMLPIIVAKGKKPGPVLGITSALHGNELNGVPVIFSLLRKLDLDELSGTVVCIPVVNTRGFFRHQRGFHDGQDLNRIFPGRPNGNCGQVFVHKLLHLVLKQFDFNLDLHTASFGRVNSFYVRADMNHQVCNGMAVAQDPQIIVHNTAPDGSLRSACLDLGIPSITVEIGNPSSFKRVFNRAAYAGVVRVMLNLKMLPVNEAKAYRNSIAGGLLVEVRPLSSPIICSRSFWIFARTGGLLTVMPEINTWVREGETIAQLRNVFGDITSTYKSNYNAVVVGKSSNPVCSTGDRIIHLGVVEGQFPVVVNDGH